MQEGEEVGFEQNELQNPRNTDDTPILIIHCLTTPIKLTLSKYELHPCRYGVARSSELKYLQTNLLTKGMQCYTVSES